MVGFPAVTLLERRSWEVNQKKDNNSPFVGECSQPSHPLRDGYGGVPSRHTLCGTVMEMLQEDNDHTFVGLVLPAVTSFAGRSWWCSQPSYPLRDGYGDVPRPSNPSAGQSWLCYEPLLPLRNGHVAEILSILRLDTHIWRLAGGIWTAKLAIVQ
jgi:hypothetical protein